MIISVMAIVTVALAMWIRSRQPARAGMPAHMDPERVKTFLERPASFSLLIFSGDQMARLHQFLDLCKYKILEENAVEGRPTDIYAALPEPTGPKNNIVFKAAYNANGYTVLFDPEMVLATDKDKLRQFCSAHGGRVVCAIWERVSETVAMVEISEAGVVGEAWYQTGKETQPPQNPPAALKGSRDANGLLNSLWESGIPKTVLNSPVKGRKYKLQE
jgi:hypothetical protein